MILDPKALEAARQRFLKIVDQPWGGELLYRVTEAFDAGVSKFIDTADLVPRSELDVLQIAFERQRDKKLRAAKERDEARRQTQEMIIERDHLLDELTEARLKAEALFHAIAHGDDDHRQWLKDAIDNHFVGKPVPVPLGSGKSQALAETRDKQLAALREALVSMVNHFGVLEYNEMVHPTAMAASKSARAVLADTAAAAAQYQLVDDEYIVVPVEPTMEMIEQLYSNWLSTTAHQTRVDAYKAMLAAIPKAGEPKTTP